jgi:SAM-dependent methyltransferase
MIRTELWRQLGGFDERFFMYGEDVDLSLRIHRAGYRCILHPGATIVHYGGRSDPVRADKMVKVNRARAQVMRKHWRAPAMRAGVVLLDLAVAARVLVHAMLAPIRPASVEKREMWRDVWAKRELWRRDEDAEALRATSRPLEGRARLAVRWARFALRSLREGHLDFVANALRAEARLVALWLGDLLPGGARVECNLCGWRGRRFYPNTGPGYDDLDTTCPGCRGLARHRSLVAILHAATDFFADGKRVIEVAPMRGFEEICRKHPGLDYTSFDLERHAMETGDITAMRWADESVDYFVGFHVLEHIPDEAKALDEIRRVLRVGGGAVLQVPIDWHVESTVEYPGPNPRDVGHVRRHGRDFAQRVASRGFEVQAITASSVVGREQFSRHGLSDEPVFIARRTGEA